MEKVCIEMPIVSACAATECAYNLNKACHARAITVGDGVHPGCDTYIKASRQAADSGHAAGIGACKTASCKFNEGLECMADSVSVGYVQNKVNCITFAAR